MFTSKDFVQLVRENVRCIIFVSVFIISAVYVYLKLLRTDPRIKKLLEKIPGPPGIPILGNAFELVLPNDEIIGVLAARMTEFNGFWKGWLVNKPYIFIGNAETAEKLLSSSVHIEKGYEYTFLENWLGTGLLTSNGKKWRHRRKMLTPTFHFRILEDFFDIFNEQSAVLVQILEEKYNHGENVVNICPIITRCALDIICETAMGEKVNAQKNTDSVYVKAISDLSELLVQRFVRPWLRIEFIWKLLLKQKLERKHLRVLHEFTEQVIQRRKQERLQMPKDEPEEDSGMYFQPKKRRLAFLDLLLDYSSNGENLSDLDIREETDTFMFEGHDTTAASINWTIFLLACNPECQMKVRNEVNEVFRETRNGKLRQTDMPKLHYLECAIKEALRMYPSVPFIARHINEDLDMGNGVIIPTGAEAFVCPIFMHRDPRYFPNPDEFMPERFDQENFVNRNPYAYVPFSAGPRNCIGQKFALMEEKVMLASIFQKFWFEPMDKLSDIKLVPDLVLRPVGGLHVKFTLANPGTEF